MGYDYYARKPVRPRPDWTDWDAVGKWLGDPRNYLRRNMWGGARLADAMVELDMAYDVLKYIPIPDFPEAEEYDCTWNDGEVIGDRAEEYRAVLADHLSWHGVSDIPGIPVHKIAGSNDGWHVTALECRAALGIYHQRMAGGEPHPEIFGDDFIPFLEACANSDGFETH